MFPLWVFSLLFRNRTNTHTHTCVCMEGSRNHQYFVVRLRTNRRNCDRKGAVEISIVDLEKVSLLKWRRNSKIILAQLLCHSFSLSFVFLLSCEMISYSNMFFLFSLHSISLLLELRACVCVYTCVCLFIYSFPLCFIDVLSRSAKLCVK